MEQCLTPAGNWLVLQSTTALANRILPYAIVSAVYIWYGIFSSEKIQRFSRDFQTGLYCNSYSYNNSEYHPFNFSIAKPIENKVSKVNFNLWTWLSQWQNLNNNAAVPRERLWNVQVAMRFKGSLALERIFCRLEIKAQKAILKFAKLRSIFWLDKLKESCL